MSVDAHLLAPDLHATSEVVPETVGGCKLVRVLGAGGMGTVWEAEDSTTGRKVAVKLLRPQAAASAEALKRFRQEGRLASQINHPNCVFVLAADEEAGRPYIVMELMTGATLKDAVDEQGPLPPEEAVAKILDVIEGLKEAHALGVIHRDVKPSNCFVLPNGRVKVGDFGLAKSLDRLTHLTVSGTFLGTVLFAAPEQIRGEPLDYRTDVYAVSATLYYLLAGQAPFQKRGNAPAALAAIVSEPVPSLRALRPDVSPALEKAVLRGLERSPGRRWPDLEALRTALLPFLPGRLSFGSMGTRLGAFLLDFGLFLPFWILVGTLDLFPETSAWQVVGFLVKYLPFLAYFVLLEGGWRASLGKQLLRLRVCAAGSAERAGFQRTLPRSVVFWVCVILPQVFLEVPLLPGGTFSWLALQGAGLLLLAAPMLFRTGYRGLHEILSGTEVITLPPPAPHHPLENPRLDRQRLGLGRPEGIPEVVGTYPVRGALYWGETEQVLLAEDPALWRDLWIWVRPAGAAAVDGVRRELDRPTRLRWVTGGQLEAAPWDAFVAPPGGSLPELVDQENRLEWGEVRQILQQLAEELSAACADDTLPDTLQLDQVWVQPNGRVLLLDFPLSLPATSARLVAASRQRRALAFLGQVAALALEGRPRPPDAPPAPVAAPLPDHAARMCRRLQGVHDPYLDLANFQADLTATRDRPPRVTRALRASHLGLVALFLFPGLAQMFSVGHPDDHSMRRIVANLYERILAWWDERTPIPSEVIDPAFVRSAIAALTIWPVLWIGWAFLMRGAVSYSLAGLSVVRANGRRASRVQCAWRVFLAWAPVTLLLILSVTRDEQASGEGFWLWWAAILLIVVYLLLALLFPVRSLHDRLAGTYLVPR